MKKLPSIFLILLVVALSCLCIVNVLALGETGLYLDNDHAVVVDSFTVPQAPEWHEPGVTKEGSKLAFKDYQTGILYVVKGVSWKNALPPWDVHEALILEKHVPGQWWPEEIAKVEEGDGSYSIKVYWYQGYVVVAYKKSVLSDWRILGTFQPSVDKLPVLAEGCTPRLEQVVGVSPIRPAISTQGDYLKYLLIGAFIVIVLVVVMRRK